MTTEASQIGTWWIDIDNKEILDYEPHSFYSIHNQHIKVVERRHLDEALEQIRANNEHLRLFEESIRLPFKQREDQLREKLAAAENSRNGEINGYVQRITDVTSKLVKTENREAALLKALEKIVQGLADDGPRVIANKAILANKKARGSND